MAPDALAASREVLARYGNMSSATLMFVLALLLGGILGIIAALYQNKPADYAVIAAATAGSTGSVSAKLRAISRDIVSNIVLAAGANLIGRAVADASAVR